MRGRPKREKKNKEKKTGIQLSMRREMRLLLIVIDWRVGGYINAIETERTDSSAPLYSCSCHSYTKPTPPHPTPPLLLISSKLEFATVGSPFIFSHPLLLFCFKKIKTPHQILFHLHFSSLGEDGQKERKEELFMRICDLIACSNQLYE